MWAYFLAFITTNPNVYRVYEYAADIWKQWSLSSINRQRANELFQTCRYATSQFWLRRQHLNMVARGHETEVLHIPYLVVHVFQRQWLNQVWHETYFSTRRHCLSFHSYRCADKTYGGPSRPLLREFLAHYTNWLLTMVPVHDKQCLTIEKHLEFP